MALKRFLVFLIFPVLQLTSGFIEDQNQGKISQKFFKNFEGFFVSTQADSYGRMLKAPPVNPRTYISRYLKIDPKVGR